MNQVHFAGEDEDDMYSGFDEYSATLDTQELEYDPAFQQAVRSSHGRRPPPTAARLGTMAVGRRGVLVPPSSMGVRPITGAQDGARPMTAVRAAGYTSGAARGTFDPMNQGAKGPAPPLEQKPEDSPEAKHKLLERKVNNLVEESCVASSRGQFQLALEKAKEAGRLEKTLRQSRERAMTSSPGNPSDQPNFDLTYSVLFNLANQYAANDMDNEALNTYSVIIKTKDFNNSGRLKVNIGNIYFKQRQFAKAIKNYRMALDQVPNTHAAMKMKIMQNIAVSFVKLGQYTDAVTSFEHIMVEEPTFRTGLNLILCYYALRDREKMKRTFERLLMVDLRLDDEHKYIATPDDKQYSVILEVIKNDSLRHIEKERKSEAEQCIMMAAKIISPVIDTSYTDGYNWCIDQVKASQYMELAHSLDIDKAIGFLKQKDFQQAVETLKSFEKKDSKVAAAAATNLAFLYNLEGEQNQADKYAELALHADRYNPAALVNKGNVLYNKGDHEKAREFYREALQNDSSCVEALYNYGICNKHLRRYEDALESFNKLHNILRNSAQVMYQLADLHDLLGESAQAREWLIQLLGVVPTDAVIEKRLGEMFDAEGDKSEAFTYYYNAYKHDCTNMAVIEWLGAYYIESQFCEKAIPYFERAALIQPHQVKWQLMVASCHRRSGNYQQALDTYKTIHRKFPDNVECLKFLVRLCTDMNLKEAQDYANKLKKAEKMHKLREERASSGRQRSAHRHTTDHREGSAKSDGDRQLSAQSRGRNINFNEAGDGPYQVSTYKETDGGYVDPLGPQAERPRTAARRRTDQLPLDEFSNEEIGEDLLPD
jgi:intraflagellar transport protein 88